MKIATVFRSTLFVLALSLTARNLAAQEKIRVAIPLFPTAAFPVLVANDRGFFQREGLTVEPIRINSAPTTYQALISGDVHTVAGAPTGLLPSHLQGADIDALGSWDNLVPYRLGDARKNFQYPRIARKESRRQSRRQQTLADHSRAFAGRRTRSDQGPDFVANGWRFSGAGERFDARWHRCHVRRCDA